MMLWRAHSRAIYLLNEYGANLPEGAVIDGDGDVINALDRIRNALIKADIAVELAGPIVNAARALGNGTMVREACGAVDQYEQRKKA